MKKIFLFFILTSFSFWSYSQKRWFTLYNDTTELVKDGNEIASKFMNDIKKIDKALDFRVSVILNTTPSLIYYEKGIANLPIWSQVIPEQQNFLNTVAGGEIEGKKAFGLFFNGFYLPHELAHGLQDMKRGDLKGSYENEYFANTVALLWWRKNGRSNELKECYDSAKAIWSKLPNPVPKGEAIEEYFSKNYSQAAQDPFVYGYIQFKQFIEICENKKLPDFDTFVGEYLADTK